MLKIFFQKKRRRKKQTSRPQTIIEKQESLLYKQYRDEAVSTLVKRTEEIAQEHGFSYNRVSIKNTKTRWGSCSSQKNINLHYKLIFLDDRLRDYVIIHELCHLREMNHSKYFWKEVENIIPNYRELAQIMRIKHPQHIHPKN